MKTLAIAALVALTSTPATAQQNCGRVDTAIETLLEKHGERPVVEGLVSDGNGATTIMQWLANEETGSWTILQVFPDGMACLRAAGTSYGHAATETVSKGDPT